MNQRILKFRAWDKENKKMVKDNFLIRPWDGMAINDVVLIPEFELMQFTGLKSKSGVEIYEGDIVAIPLRWGKPTPARCEVAFEEGGFVAVSFNQHVIVGKGPRFLTLKLTDPEGVEIIGNIYENPELLK